MKLFIFSSLAKNALGEQRCLRFSSEDWYVEEIVFAALGLEKWND